jgi:hypothetical protein
MDDFKVLLRKLDHLEPLGLFADTFSIEGRIVAFSVGLASNFGEHEVHLSPRRFRTSRTEKNEVPLSSPLQNRKACVHHQQ